MHSRTLRAIGRDYLGPLSNGALMIYTGARPGQSACRSRKTGLSIANLCLVSNGAVIDHTGARPGQSAGRSEKTGLSTAGCAIVSKSFHKWRKSSADF